MKIREILENVVFNKTDDISMQTENICFFFRILLCRIEVTKGENIEED